jgi:hypothetical protein
LLRGRVALRRIAGPCRYTLSVLSIGHLVDIDEISIQINSVQREFVFLTPPTFMTLVASHLELACWDERRVAGDGSIAVAEHQR